MDIAAMLLWIFTAAAGVYLLAAGRPARQSADAAVTPAAESSGTANAAASAGAAAVAVSAAAGGSGGSAMSRPAPAGVPPAAAAAYAAGAKVPPINHTRITTRPGEHPLLEFMHPALGIVGLGAWIGFVVTRYRAFAWVAFGVLVVTIAAGLTWFMINRRAARRATTAAQGPATADRGQRAPDEPPAAPGHGQAAPDQDQPAPRSYPRRQILLHGAGAAVTFALAVVTALIAGHP